MLLRKQVDSCASARPCALPVTESLSSGARQPERVLDFYLVRTGRTLADHIDGIVRLDAFLAEAGDVIFRRMLVRVNHQPVDLTNRFIAQLRHAHAGEMKPRLYPIGADHLREREFVVAAMMSASLIASSGVSTARTSALDFGLHFFDERFAIGLGRAEHVDRA